MITYEIRSGISPQTVRIELDERHRFNMQPGATLWQVERESEAEAAVRRIGWLNGYFDYKFGKALAFSSGRCLNEFVDEHCPPPAPKETQLDWNTGEPIETIHTLLNNCGVWWASFWPISDHGPNSEHALKIVKGETTTGQTRDAAIANLRAIRASLKSKTK